MTLASLWAGKPQITELVIIRPVLNLPLRRERAQGANRRLEARGRQGHATAFSIEHVSVTGGTIVFSNLRDRVENRIETVNADVAIDADRKISAHRQRAPQRLSAEIRDQGDAARRRRSSGRISRPRSGSTRPACCAPRSPPRPKSGSTAPS